MVWQINNRGTFVIDRRFKGIGRIRRASGTTSKETLQQIVSMLKEFYETGKHAVLREIQRGTVTPIEVFGYWREGKLDHIPSAATLKPILPTITDWILSHNVTDITKRNYTFSIKRFADIAGNVQIQDLPEAVEVYRQHCMDAGKHRSFNFARTPILAYLRATFGRSHHLYQAVSGIRTLTEKTKRQAPQLSVAEAVELMRALPPVHSEIARAMLLTGMGWTEVLNEWWIESDRVVIKGTKAKGRDRFVPLIDPDLKRPERGTKAFRTQLKKVRPDVSPYSFRRTFAHWLEMAGVPRARRRMYLGHSGKDVTDLYERHDVARFLQTDAKLFKDWFFAEWEKSKKEEPSDPKAPSPIFLLKPRKGS